MTQFSIESAVENFNKMYKPLNLKVEYSKYESTKINGFLYDDRTAHNFKLYAKYDFELSSEYSMVLSFNAKQVQFNLSPLTPEQYFVFHQFYELIDWFVFKNNSIGE